MSVCIDDIDLSEVPGYTPITKATPIWKRDMIEKKNQEKLEEYIQMKEREKMEAEKWKNVPEWKRKLMMEKEREKSKMSEENQKKKSKAKDKPSEKELMADVKAKEAEEEKKAKEAEEEKKARLKEQQEMQKRMEEELESVPAWKREIMMKKGGAIKNWGDEREDINKQEDENDAPPEVNEQDHKEQNNDPNRVFVQKAVLIMKPVGQNNTPNNKDTPSQKAPVKNTPVKGTSTPPKARLSLDENKLEEEWESLPLWKREILQKKGGAPSNWGDERAELNEEMIDH